LANCVGEFGRFAGEQLAECVAQVVVADVEVAKDLCGDAVALSTERE
jgi:hypothetical protein